MRMVHPRAACRLFENPLPTTSRNDEAPGLVGPLIRGTLPQELALAQDAYEANRSGPPLAVPTSQPSWKAGRGGRRSASLSQACGILLRVDDILRLSSSPALFRP